MLTFLVDCFGRNLVDFYPERIVFVFVFVPEMDALDFYVDIV
jgi:hypothetical protein